MARIILSDLNVILDDVTFRKNYFQNRCKIVGRDGQLFWLTLPVPPTHRLIYDMPLGREVAHVMRKWRVTFTQCYSRSTGWDEVWPYLDHFIESISVGRTRTLADASVASIEILSSLLGFPFTPIRSSTVRVTRDRTEHLIGCAKSLHADRLLFGWGEASNSSVHNILRISDAGIRILRLNKVRASVVEPVFVKEVGVSTLHWLFTLGCRPVADKLREYNRAVEHVE